MTKSSYIINSLSISSKDEDDLRNNFKALYQNIEHIISIDHNKIFYDQVLKNGCGFIENTEFVIFQNQDLYKLFVIILSKWCQILEYYGIHSEDVYLEEKKLEDHSSFLCLLNDNEIALVSSKTSNYVKDQLRFYTSSMELYISNVFDKESIDNYFCEKIEAIIEDRINNYNYIDRTCSTEYKKIQFHDNFTSEYRDADVRIKNKCIDIFQNIILGRKKITDFDSSDESRSVKNNPSMLKEREVRFSGLETIVLMHVKMMDGFRLYFKEENGVLLIGKLTTHLSTAKF